MSHNLDIVYFEKLESREPGDVCVRSKAEYNVENKSYLLPFLEERYEIIPGKREIRNLEEKKHKPSVELELLLLSYLLKGKNLPLAGKWVSESGLKGGAMFFRGPHAFRHDVIAEKFGFNLDFYRERCLTMGGKAFEMGDAAFLFQVLPRIPVVSVLWYGDDEFAPSAKLLMDSSIESHLPLDVIFGMALELYGKMVGKRLWI